MFAIGRASCVKITSKGRELLHKVQPLLVRWTEGILSALSAREQSQLVALLRKTQRAFSERRDHFNS